jgi:hypothetical protein
MPSEACTHRGHRKYGTARTPVTKNINTADGSGTVADDAI